MSINNHTVGTTEMTPVETEVTRSEKQESATLVAGGSRSWRGFRHMWFSSSRKRSRRLKTLQTLDKQA